MICVPSSLKPFLIAGILYLLIAASWPISISANTVLISEIHPAPYPGEQEWFELFNYGEHDIDLNGWTAYDQLSSPSLLTSFSHQVIKSYEPLVVTIASAKLNNSGDGVTLFQSDGAEIDSLRFFTSQTGSSWHRIASQSAEVYQALPNPGAWNPALDQDETPTPTPSTAGLSPVPTYSPTPLQEPLASSTPTPTIDISGLIISEVLSCPISPETEWVELWNNQDRSLLLADWSITDQQNNRVTFTQDFSAKQHVVISWSKSMLNNAGDTLILEDSARLARLVLEVPNCVPGHSYALFSNEYLWVTPPSKGASNQTATVADSPTPAPTPSTQVTSSQNSTNTVSTLASNDDQQDHSTHSAIQSNFIPSIQLFTISTASSSTQPTDAQSPPDVLSPSEFSHFSPWPYLNVIIGGSLIASSGCLLYVKQSIDTVAT